MLSIVSSLPNKNTLALLVIADSPEAAADEALAGADEGPVNPAFLVLLKFMIVLRN
jgi:hypothetical protein